MSTFQRFVALPSGHTGIDSRNLAVCLRSLASELDKLDYTKVKGFQIDGKERKLVVTLEGFDVEKIRRDMIKDELARLNEQKKGKRK